MRLGIRRVAPIAAGILLLTLAGCVSGGAADAGPTDAPVPAGSAGPTGSITVFAAASLTSTFTTLAEEFQEINPSATVDLSFAGSSDLATQITEGAPADVFASADEKNMAKLTDGGLITAVPVYFATNVLTIAVPPGNPAGVEDFADLGSAETRTVICAAQVPCGAATEAVEAATGVTIPAVSEESSVTDVLGKVLSGEADAGLVYVTDVTAAGDSVEGIEFAEAAEAVNTYPIAPLAASANAALAQAFVDFVVSDEGLGVLAAAGFGAP